MTVLEVRGGYRRVVRPFAVLVRRGSTDPSGENAVGDCLGDGGLLGAAWRVLVGYLTQAMRCGAAWTVIVSRVLGLAGVAVWTGAGFGGAGDRRSCQTRRAR